MGLAPEHVRLAAKAYMQWKDKGGRVEDFVLRGQKPVWLSVKKARAYAEFLEKQNFYEPGVTSEDDVCRRVNELREMNSKAKCAAAPCGLVDKLTEIYIDKYTPGNSLSDLKLCKKHQCRSQTYYKYNHWLSSAFEVYKENPPNREIIRASVVRVSKLMKARQFAHNMLFSTIDELGLVSISRAHEDAGYPLSHSEFIAIAKGILNKKNEMYSTTVQVSDGDMHTWLHGFLNRHSEHLRLRKAQACSADRVLQHDSAVVDAWLEHVHDVEAQLILEGKLSAKGFEAWQILNYDEANTDVNGKPVNTLVSRTTKDNNRLATGDKGPFHVTYGCLTNASGDILATQLIHATPKGNLTWSVIDGLNSPAETAVKKAPALAEDAPIFLNPDESDLKLSRTMKEYKEMVMADTWQAPLFISATENGWQNCSSFHAWLEYILQVVIAYREKKGGRTEVTPMVLFVDNHYSRCMTSDDAINLYERCEQHNLQIMFLPSHLSHVLQPNDRGLHSHVKAIYSRCLEWYIDDEKACQLRAWYTHLNKRDFNIVFLRTLAIITAEGRSQRVIADGFKNAGLLPNSTVLVSFPRNFQVGTNRSWSVK